MKHYNFKKRSLFSGPHLLGLLLLAAGIFTIISPLVFKSNNSFAKTSYVGVTAIILGTIIVSSYSGTIIDFNNKRVKNYFSLLGYQFGEWAALPNIKRIAVITVKYNTTNTPNGISPTWSGPVTNHKVFLYSENSKPIYSFVFSNEERAVKTAKLLSGNLNAVCEFRNV